jgi:hypothetical protein
MSVTHASIEDHDEPGLYEIRLKGCLDARWADWFEGLTTTALDKGIDPFTITGRSISGWKKRSGKSLKERKDDANFSHETVSPSASA